MKQLELTETYIYNYEACIETKVQTNNSINETSMTTKTENLSIAWENTLRRKFCHRAEYVAW